MSTVIKKSRAPVRIDFGGGTTDIKPFTDTHGGAVLNATINHYVYGTLIASPTSTKVEYHADIPTSSGLGTSSAMNVVWTSLITPLKDKKEICESVYKIEQATSSSAVNGKQDFYAAAFGGINYMEFKGDKTTVERLNLDKKTLYALENNLVLVYSGITHLSGSSNKAAIDNLLKGKNTNELIALREIAKSMKSALLKNNLDKFAELMNQETRFRSLVSKQTVSQPLQKIIESGKKNGAISAKVCGSGGGGSILFYTNDPVKLKKFFRKKVINFKFDFEGLTWIK
ncbi:hypothetical protein COU57_04730 [Candidatus Pacearchaeota archaeon CG10_big_fil_rev_8_21_14_0_10_32_14]|nr:MAG: hypothetical protein COU57_04730 [Candidatus Pacearchaeota archaeon CG10_big_fil_rev_8_21_14_0_10_32_14]